MCAIKHRRCLTSKVGNVEAIIGKDEEILGPALRSESSRNPTGPKAEAGRKCPGGKVAGNTSWKMSVGRKQIMQGTNKDAKAEKITKDPPGVSQVIGLLSQYLEDQVQQK